MDGNNELDNRRHYRKEKGEIASGFGGLPPSHKTVWYKGFGASLRDYEIIQPEERDYDAKRATVLILLISLDASRSRPFSHCC